MLPTAWGDIKYGVSWGAGLGGSPGWVELGVDTSYDGLEAIMMLLVKCSENKKVKSPG